MTSVHFHSNKHYMLKSVFLKTISSYVKSIEFEWQKFFSGLDCGGDVQAPSGSNGVESELLSIHRGFDFSFLFFALAVSFLPRSPSIRALLSLKGSLSWSPKTGLVPNELALHSGEEHRLFIGFVLFLYFYFFLRLGPLPLFSVRARTWLFDSEASFKSN